MVKQTLAFLRINFQDTKKMSGLEMYEYFKKYLGEPDLIEKYRNEITALHYKSNRIEKLKDQWGINIPLIKPMMEYESIDIFIDLSEEIKNKLFEINKEIPLQNYGVEVLLEYSIIQSFPIPWEELLKQ